MDGRNEEDICDRPGEATLVAQGPAIAKFEGRPGNGHKGDIVNHFELRRVGGGLGMIVGEERFAIRTFGEERPKEESRSQHLAGRWQDASKDAPVIEDDVDELKAGVNNECAKARNDLVERGGGGGGGRG